MTSISRLPSSIKSIDSNAANRLAESLDHGPKGDVKSSFQDFAGGTFYKEMLKSMRKMHGKAAYFSGGQAEHVFQSQMDQQVAEDLARSHGSQLTDSLYQAFLRTGRV